MHRCQLWGHSAAHSRALVSLRTQLKKYGVWCPPGPPNGYDWVDGIRGVFCPLSIACSPKQNQPWGQGCQQSSIPNAHGPWDSLLHQRFSPLASLPSSPGTGNETDREVVAPSAHCMAGGRTPSSLSVGSEGEQGPWAGKACGREEFGGGATSFPKCPVLPGGPCVQTYLICSVVQSMEAQVSLRKGRRCGQREAGSAPSGPSPRVWGAFGTELGVGMDSLPLTRPTFAFKQPPQPLGALHGQPDGTIVTLKHVVLAGGLAV